MQSDDWRTASDEGLRTLFSAASGELPEQDFTAAVMKLVRRSARRRRIRVSVIGAALATGVLLALGPLVEFATIAWPAMRAFPWDDEGLRSVLAASTRMHSIPVLAVLACALGWPIFVRWVER